MVADHCVQSDLGADGLVPCPRCATLFSQCAFAKVLATIDQVGSTPEENETLKARSLIEKKSVINLLEAFAVAVKHYLRGEDGIYYMCDFLLCVMGWVLTNG